MDLNMKNFAKALIVVSLLAGAGMASQVAMAAVVPVPQSTGSLAPTSQTLVVKGSATKFVANYGRDFTEGQNKLFSDSYTFKVVGTSEAGGTVSAAFTSSQDLYIKSFDIYSALTNTVVIAGVSELKSNAIGKNDFWSLPEDSTLSAGNYYVKVTGQILGLEGGTYAATLNVTSLASAVPEAETYAMMLAGLGLVGFVGRRKAAKKAA
jgi:hypothetical protein